MENRLNIPFNCLKFHTIRILRSIIENDSYTIREIRQFLQPCNVSDEELRELGSVETVEQLWEFLIRKKIITMHNVKALKTIAKNGVKSEELEKEVEEYEQNIGGLVMKIGIGLGIELAVLSFLGEEQKRIVFEKLVFPRLVRLVEVCKGSVCFMVETTSLSSLKQLWMSYKDGLLREKLKKAINEINEVRKLTNGTEIDLTVEIDEDEYHEACWVLMFVQINQVDPDSCKSVQSQPLHSFSCEQDLLVHDHDKLHRTWQEWTVLKEMQSRLMNETQKRKNAEKQVKLMKEEMFKSTNKETRQSIKTPEGNQQLSSELETLQKTDPELAEPLKGDIDYKNNKIALETDDKSKNGLKHYALSVLYNTVNEKEDCQKNMKEAENYLRQATECMEKLNSQSCNGDEFKSPLPTAYKVLAELPMNSKQLDETLAVLEPLWTTDDQATSRFLENFLVYLRCLTGPVPH